MAARAGGKLSDGTKARIDCLLVGKRRKAALANGLIAVHLREVWLVYSARADVLRVDASGSPQLMLQAETPLHEIGRMKFSIGHCGNGDGRKTSSGIRQRGRAGKLALPKALIAVVVAEFLASDRGIGFLIVRAANLMNTAGVFAGTITLAVLVYLLIGAMGALEKFLLRWKPREKQ